MSNPVIWQTAQFEIIRAVAYFSAGFALLKFFLLRDAAIIGPKRWVFIWFLFSMAGMQLLVLYGIMTGAVPVIRNANLIASLCLLATGTSLWPFLALVRSRLTSGMNRRMQKRLDFAQAKAVKTRRWMELAEEIANVGHWTISVPGYELFWSDEIYRIHGLDKNRYTPEIASAINAFHPDDRERVRHHIEDAIAKDLRYDWEARLVRPDGEIRHVISRGMTQRDETGAITVIFGVFLDVTGQKRIEEKLQRANVLAEQTNKSLMEMALLDSLTGLPNRRHFDAAYETEFRRAIRENTLLGLIIIDLDHFKGFNDTYGHPAGDECLRKVAAIIAKVPQRAGDMVARYGGEELVVLIPHINVAGARALAQYISETISALGIEHKANTEGIVTISSGLAVFDPQRDPHTSLTLFQRADRALYQAKVNGRNRVMYDPGNVQGIRA